MGQLSGGDLVDTLLWLGWSGCGFLLLGDEWVLLCIILGKLTSFKELKGK